MLPSSSYPSPASSPVPPPPACVPSPRETFLFRRRPAQLLLRARLSGNRARAEGAEVRHCRLRLPPGSFGHRADAYGRRLACDAPPAARRRRASKPVFSCAAIAHRVQGCQTSSMHAACALIPFCALPSRLFACGESAAVSRLWCSPQAKHARAGRSPALWFSRNGKPSPTGGR